MIKSLSSVGVLTKLRDLKKSGIKLIASDYDGTLFDRNNPRFNNPEKVIKLIYEVVNAGIEFLLISARNTTLEVEFSKTVSKISKQKKQPLTIWKSGGNGMNLVKVTYYPDFAQPKYKTIYSRSISIADIKRVLQLYKGIAIQSDPQSCAFFKQYIDKKLPEEFVPKKYVKLMLSFNGSIFIEKVKISLVLPRAANKQKRIIAFFKEQLEQYGLNVGYGGLPFIDISKKFEMNGKAVDGKLFALKTLIKRLNIDENAVATFGDSPKGNDKGLLSLSNSFTNAFVKNHPPYTLTGNKTKIIPIYNAIHYLISK